MSNTIVCLTSKDLELMVEEGGCGYWKANLGAIEACKYVVAIRNRNSSWCKGDEPHRAAFLIGEISDVEQYENRKLIKISRFAAIPGLPIVTWPGASPIHYRDDITSLRINPDELDWKEWPSPKDRRGERSSGSLTIQEAKEKLAESFGVAPDQVKITIEA